MTNREWLNGLSDDDYVTHWTGVVVRFMLSSRHLIYPPKSISKSLSEWLKKEHKENGKEG